MSLTHIFKKHKIASRITRPTHSIKIYGVVSKNKESAGNS